MAAAVAIEAHVDERALLLTKEQGAWHRKEYLRKHPKRTWLAWGGASSRQTEIDVLREALRGVIRQLEALLDRPTAQSGESPEPADPAVPLLHRICRAPDGRMHKLEAHKPAREVGLDRARLARLYTADPPLLTTDHQDRVITGEGRACLAQHPQAI